MTEFLRGQLPKTLSIVNEIIIDYVITDKTKKYIDACLLERQHAGKYDYSLAATTDILTNKDQVSIYCLQCMIRNYGEIPDPSTSEGRHKWGRCQFSTRYTDHITKLYGCQRCSTFHVRGGSSISEIAALEVANEVFLSPEEIEQGKIFKPTTQKSPEASWLLDGCIAAGKKPNECLKLDGFCVTDKYGPVAIEYQGIQHYQFPNKFHRTRADFNAQRARDVLKESICLDNGVCLVRVKYTMTYRNRDKMKNFMMGFIP